MIRETFFIWLLWAIRGMIVVGIGLFIYAMLWLHDDTMKMYARLDPFIQQCESAGNHMERHNDKNGNPRMGCYEGPKPKLIKEFE